MKVYFRVCKYCGKTFETSLKYSKVCSECFEKRHKEKVLNNLFNGSQVVSSAQI